MSTEPVLTKREKFLAAAEQLMDSHEYDMDQIADWQGCSVKVFYVIAENPDEKTAKELENDQ